MEDRINKIRNDYELLKTSSMSCAIPTVEVHKTIKEDSKTPKQYVAVPCTSDLS